ncbi:flotillin-like protein 6 [Corylus avellana]|uniref:flotillin-like protein 6 n=1 Tax=Corylus avellana TaxID=13451 RepID=UPI001E232139|nr:flotillin-like protein 6 [Corylus avellana]
MGWRVAGPSEYLAITGRGIDDICLAKKAWVLPGQRCSRFDVSQVNYTFEVEAMSAEKLPFVVSTIFTIGPRVDDMDSLLLYGKVKLFNHVNELVQGVIEGETRVLAARTTIEEIFKAGINEFKKEVFEKVQLELNQYGLRIYNANVETKMEAANEAKVSSSLNSGMAETVGDAESASSGINPTYPPSCEAHRNTEACSKCVYSKYQPEPKNEFKKILTPTDVQLKGSYSLYLPKSLAARFCLPANGSHPVSVYDVQMKRWPMHFRTNGEKAYLTRGWSRFAQAKQLSEGDNITFYELRCQRGTGTKVFMIGVSRKQCIQILGAPIRI